VRLDASSKDRFLSEVQSMKLRPPITFTEEGMEILARAEQCANVSDSIMLKRDSGKSAKSESKVQEQKHFERRISTDVGSDTVTSDEQ
jgi:hypothetical protein